MMREGQLQEKGPSEDVTWSLLEVLQDRLYVIVSHRNKKQEHFLLYSLLVVTTLSSSSNIYTAHEQLVI